MESKSKTGQLDVADITNLGYNALLVGASAVLTYISANLVSVDLDVYGPVVVAVISPVLDAAIKFLTNNKK